MADHTVTVESTLEALLVEKKYSTIRDILSTMNPADIASVFDGLEESRFPLIKKNIWNSTQNRKNLTVRKMKTLWKHRKTL